MLRGPQIEDEAKQYKKALKKNTDRAVVGQMDDSSTKMWLSPIWSPNATVLVPLSYNIHFFWRSACSSNLKITTYLHTMRWVSAVSVVTGQQAGWFGVQIHAEARDFSLLQSVKTGSGAHHPLFIGYKVSSLDVKWEGCEIDLSHQCSVKVKNEWNYISTSPIRLHGINRDNFTLTCASDYMVSHPKGQWSLPH